MISISQFKSRSNFNVNFYQMDLSSLGSLFSNYTPCDNYSPEGSSFTHLTIIHSYTHNYRFLKICKQEFSKVS